MRSSSPELIKHVKYFEGCRLVAYPDPKTGADPWTVGWGATGHGIERGTIWTQQQADARLLTDLAEREDVINAKLWRYLNTQGEFDAMVDILYNVGFGTSYKDGIFRLKNGNPSTLIRRVMSGDMAAAKLEYMKWVSPGSNVEKGLRRRRLSALRLWDGLSFVIPA